MLSCALVRPAYSLFKAARHVRNCNATRWQTTRWQSCLQLPFLFLLRDYECCNRKNDAQDDDSLVTGGIAFLVVFLAAYSFVKISGLELHILDTRLACVRKRFRGISGLWWGVKGETRWKKKRRADVSERKRKAAGHQRYIRFLQVFLVNLKFGY